MLDNHEALNGVQYHGLCRAAAPGAGPGSRRAGKDPHPHPHVPAGQSAPLGPGCHDDPACWLSGAANLWQGRTGVEQVPYVVLVDHLGNHAPLLKLAEQPVTPEQSIIIGTLMTWLEHVRMISSDSVVLGKNWERVEDYTSQAALKQLEGFRREQKAAAAAGAPGRDHAPAPAAHPESPRLYRRSGKRRPTITMASSCPRNRGGGRPHWSLPIFSPRWPSRNGTSVASNGTIATCWGLWWMT